VKWNICQVLENWYSSFFGFAPAFSSFSTCLWECLALLWRRCSMCDLWDIVSSYWSHSCPYSEYPHQHSSLPGNKTFQVAWLGTCCYRRDCSSTLGGSSSSSTLVKIRIWGVYLPTYRIYLTLLPLPCSLWSVYWLTEV